MDTNNNLKKYVSFLDYFNIVLKYKKFILSFSLLAALLTAFIMFVILDPIYLSKATVKSTSKSSGLGGVFSGTMAGLSDLSELGGGGSYKELALYENILYSRRCIEETIDKFNLNSEWDYKYKEDAVKYFKESVLELTKDKVAGTMDIGVFDKYPNRAKEISEFLIAQLNKINTEMNVLNAKNNREFIENRYKEVKESLKNSEDSLKLYQEKFGLSPDLQASVVTQAGLGLEVQLKSEEIKLDLLTKMLSKDQPEIKMQQDKIDVIKKQLETIQNSDSEGGIEMMRLKNAPSKIMNFLRLKRDVEIQNKILTYILPLFEQAKIDEKKDTPTVIILDYPNIPEKKSKPKRLTMTLLAFLLAFGLSAIGTVVYDKRKVFIDKINF